uniref:Uncharacterized protein n=1 Tax=Strigamia maritima TaxID=126957 RepID=T1J8T8_STRMM
MNLSDTPMTTRFHRAIQDGDVQSVEAFLALGVDGNEPDWDNNGKIALLEATCLSNVQMVEALIKGGCSPNSRDCQGQTALHAAVRSRVPNAALVNLLLAAGADAALSDTVSGMSPLHLLIQQATSCRSHVERAMFVCVLHAILPGSNVDGATHGGDTALHLAAKGPSVALVKVLLDVKADVNCQNARGETPLMVAIVNNQVNIAKMILDGYNCDVNIRDRYHQTALHYAANFNSSVVIDNLLLCNCDVNAVDLNKDTALHLAAGKAHAVAIQLLLKCVHIKPQIKNINGKRAADIVEESSFNHLKKLFLSKNEDDVILRHPEKLERNDRLMLPAFA